jgi:hypothetical protein
MTSTGGNSLAAEGAGVGGAAPGVVVLGVVVPGVVVLGVVVLGVVVVPPAGGVCWVEAGGAFCALAGTMSNAAMPAACISLCVCRPAMSPPRDFFRLHSSATQLTRPGNPR